ncbi:glycosyltransferase family 2 protein [Hymenobacter saemangeumensis]|uniref:Glycosyltransferase family 2 protein n=1 Tax=Hymenobacter saemangeumensis TaxID=1084522 RepID=A0ABP8ISB8_9BACT
MQEFPSVSVIIPSWNQGRFIERTLLSILRQDYPGAVQVIVSDGGSTDETVAVLQRYSEQITWWSAPDRGFVDAVSKGLARATGEVVAIQSSDDFYLPGAFRHMALAFRQFPEAGFISGGEYGIDLHDRIEYVNAFTGLITPHSILFRFVPPQHSTFARRPVLELAGGMRAEVDMCADIDLWYRVAHFAPGQAIPQLLSAYQLHPEQRTATSPKWFSSLVNMVESCEADAFYGQRFRLQPAERRSLYTYWEVNWAARRSLAEARPLAWRKLPGLLGYSPRTRRTVLGATIVPLLKKLLPARLLAWLRPPSYQATYEQAVDFTWWKS